MFIKYKSNMNLNLSKSPQSNTLSLIIEKKNLHFRVSTLPSYDSNSIVLRINHYHFTKKVSDLLLNKEEEKLFSLLESEIGLVLITGPTCSGKTTLSYCLLQQLKNENLAIVSIEDPIEYFETGFVQLQVNEQAGVNYETGVKEILRHDPDVIFIGEIRDKYTARCAIRASLTGHRVITTMHATSPIKAIYRLIELGISPFEIEQTLLLVTNQRLVQIEKSKKITLEYLTAKQIKAIITNISRVIE